MRDRELTYGEAWALLLFCACLLAAAAGWAAHGALR